MRNQLDCPWRKQANISFSLARCLSYFCTYPGAEKKFALCEDDIIPDWCPHREALT